MKDTDFQHIHHIKTYCENIAETVVHFGNDYNIFESAHAYISINKSVIWESATRDVPAVLDFCTKIIEQNEEAMDQKQDMGIKME